MRNVITVHVIIYKVLILFVTCVTIWSVNRPVYTVEGLDPSYSQVFGKYVDPHLTPSENEEMLEEEE